MCSSGVSFNPVIDGTRYEFELFGLFNAVMVMADLQTGSIWSHLNGVALDGPLEGAQLEWIPMVQTTWEQWVELHPDTLVLSDDTEYRDWYSTPRLGGAELGPEFLESIVYWDDRLPSNQLVLGVGREGQFKAYPGSTVVESGGVVNDELAGHPIVVIIDRDSVYSVAYSREVEGQVLTFYNAAEGDIELVDEETGSIWNLEGKAIAGSLEGTSLTFVSSYLTEWYGWSAYHPQTEIFGE